MRKFYHSLTSRFITGIRTTQNSAGLSSEKQNHFIRALRCVLILMLFTGSINLSAAIVGKTDVCENESVLYTHAFTPGYTYIWNAFGAAQQTPNSNTLAVTWGPASLGPGLITLEIKNSFGVTVNTLSVSVTIHPLPEPEIVPLNANGCSYQVLSPGDGTFTVVSDSTDVCYLVCDSTIFKYEPGTVNPNHSYKWSVIPSSAALGLTTTASGLAIVQWGVATPNQVTLRLHATDIITGCSDSVDVCVRIIARPQANFVTFPAATAGTVNVCLNATVAFFDQSTSDPNSTLASWIWNFGDGSFSTQQHPSHSYSVAGTYQVKLLVENQCHCRDSAYVTVVVHSLPGPDITCVSPLCYNSTDTYCTSYSCAPFQWSVSNGTITSGAGTSCINVSWGSNGPGSVVLQGSTCVGACAYPTSVLVPILSPTTIISGPNPACENSTAFYSVPNVPATTYSWTVVPSGSIMTGQGSNAISVYWDQAPGTRTVKVTYTNAFLNCSGAADYVVAITPKHVITGDATVCEGTMGFYASNSSMSDWWVVNPFGGVIFSTTSPGLSFNFPTAGAYMLYANDVTGSLCNSPAAFQVQVVGKPPKITAAINTSICPGGTYLYTGVPTNNNYYLKWTVVGGVPNQNTGNAISVIWNTTGPWSIALSQVGVMPPSCESDTTLYIMVNPPPPAPTINGNNSTCFNKSESYSTNSVADSYDWLLMPGPGTYGSIIPGTTPNNISVQFNNGSSVQTATLFLQITKCGSSTTSSLVITLNPPPTPAIISPVNICENQVTTFFTPTGGSAYSWDFGDGSSPASGSSVNHIYTTALPFVVSLTVTNPGGCIGTVVTSTIINVKPTPVANVTSPNQLSGGCNNGLPFSYNVFASVQTITGTPTYTWAPPITTGNTGVVTTVGAYSMSVEINGCIASTVFLVDTLCTTPGGGQACVYANPGNNSATIGYTVDCTGVNFSPTISGAGGMVSSWIFGPGSATSTATSPSFVYPASGYYFATLNCQWPAFGGGWCYQSTTTLVTVPIDADFKYDFGCGSPNLAVDFIDQSNWIPGTAVSYTWDVNPGALSSNLQNQTWNLNTGIYTVSLTISGGGQVCMVTNTLFVPQRPVPGFAVAGNVCEGNPITFTNTSSPAGDVTQYNWSFGDGTGLLTQNASPNGVRVYDYSPLNPFYSANLTITDVYGCTDTFGPVAIQVNQNAFTINNVTVTPSLAQICQGDSVQLCLAMPTATDPANTNAPFSYFWTNFETGACTYAKQPGSYGVVATDVFGCKSVQKTAAVNVIIVPTPLVAGEQSYCEGALPYLSIDRGPGFNYQWIYDIQGLGGGITPPCVSPLFSPPSPTCAPMTPSVSAGFTGTISVQGRITEVTSGLGCNALGPIETLTIHPLPASPVVGTSVCESGAPIDLTATGAGPAAGQSIIWNTGQQGSLISVIPSGKYWASVVDANGCKSIADTAHLWPLPDFNSLIFGCYEICNTGSTIVPVPSGYALYTWIKNNATIVEGPSSSPTPLNFTNPSTYGGNAGSYQLVLVTNQGCTATSPPINITVVPCLTCDINVSVDSISCYADGDATIDSYYFEYTLNFGGPSAAQFTLSVPNGTLALSSPSLNVISPGSNTFVGTFTPVANSALMCMSFSLAMDDDPDFNCTWDTCLLMPPCNPPPCELHVENLSITCLKLDANGNPVYNYNLNYNYGGSSTGTVLISSGQGIMSPASGTANPGSNFLSGSFTDMPLPDGTLCIDLYVYNAIDGWCHAQVCKPLPLVNPCFRIPQNCQMEVKPQATICYSINSMGQIMYALNYDINNFTAATYSFHLLSSSGFAGAPSPSLISPGLASFTNTFVYTGGSTPPPQICFTLVATNIANGQKCRSIFCVAPQPCPADMRMMSTVNMNLYPNPADNFTIAEYVLDDKAAINRLHIIDINGRMVQELILNDTHGQVQINTAALVPGMYFVKAMNNERTVLVKKLIIQQ